VTDAIGRLLQSSEFFADPPPHLIPRPPLWVDEALGARGRRRDVIGPVLVDSAPPLAVLTTTVTGARALSPDDLRRRVADAYVAIGHALTAIDRVPIRFWNFVPDPGEPMGDGLDRYMVFNAGRCDGYASWLCASTLSRRSASSAKADELRPGAAVLFPRDKDVPERPAAAADRWHREHRRRTLDARRRRRRAAGARTRMPPGAAWGDRGNLRDLRI
jgi:hypothetical protein